MQPLANYWSPQALEVNGLIFLHLLGAALLGAAIGYERSYHGRAAGMRTYALVCFASAALVVINGYPQYWFGGAPAPVFPLHNDPTRVIQGIVTGIGFLGAGMIIREGFSIRGLSTAASIWVTAAVGILVGIGFYGAAIAGGVLTLVTMGGVRWIESRLPQQTLTHCHIRYSREAAPGENALRQLAEQHGFSVVEMSYKLGEGGSWFEYQLTLRSYGKGMTDQLARTLAADPLVREFKLSPLRD